MYTLFIKYERDKNPKGNTGKTYHIKTCPKDVKAKRVKKDKGIKRNS